jgi:hypothetical protein
MTTDETEPYRRRRVAELAAQQTDNRKELEQRHGRVWNTAELGRDYEVKGFMAPYVIVRCKATDKLGSMEFQHEPRYYFGYQPDE